MFDSVVPDINSSTHLLANNSVTGLGVNNNQLEKVAALSGTQKPFNNLALSPVFLEPLQVNELVDAAVGIAQQSLVDFFSKPDFSERMQIPFGDSFNLEKSIALAQAISNDNLMALSKVKVLSDDVLNGAFGAYDALTGKIYLSDSFVALHASNPKAIANVLLEEFGHFIDSEVNTVDAPGDEGEIFAAIVQGKAITEAELIVLQAEDDRAFITVNNQVVEIEQARKKKQGDFDGDGISDLFRQERGSWLNGNRDAEIYLSNGSWGFKNPVSLPNGSSFDAERVNLVFGDFNGDRKTDFIRQEKGNWVDGTNDVQLFFSRGDGTFNSPTNLSNSWNGNDVNLIVGDFTGGGADDIIRQEKGSMDKRAMEKLAILMRFLEGLKRVSISLPIQCTVKVPLK
ncbi:FG-GAP-like repeat-containing protein [Scytonema sp. NUACC26]|uniref:FG-GAP-like repeat-containing protein n=1 Tax=Scytonema sp. NUACC26 TaxID=3140176 RepID=UPI0034DC3C5D